MGWFDEQIKQRIKADENAFEEAFVSMASVITGQNLETSLLDERQKIQNAVEEILKFYHVKSMKLPEEITDINEQLEYLLRPSGIMRRVVRLEGEWYKEAAGAFLAVSKEGGVVALLPDKMGGYHFFDYLSGKKLRLNQKNANLLERDAICFYKPLPIKKIGIPDLLSYLLRAISFSDYMWIGGTTLAATLVGLFLPKLNHMLFSKVIDSQSMQLLWVLGFMIMSFGISGLLINTVKFIIMERIRTKTTLAVQAASMMRLLSLPAAFFKDYSAGELSVRIKSIDGLCNMLENTLLSIGLSSVFSLAYISQIFLYAKELVIPALMIILVTVLYSLMSTMIQMKLSEKAMKFSGKESGLVYALISGVQKIKLSGAEKRAFAKWADVYRKKAKYLYDPPLLIKLNAAISTGINLVGTIIIYYVAVKSQVKVADYFSFNIAYGMVSGAFMALSSVALSAANIKPVLEMVRPILETVPEIAPEKKVITRISGGIEFNNVSFQYQENMPKVVDNLSLKIRPGQYIALVGKTGCGKSTLMRLMLGFEIPQKGAIYYDGKDLSSIDLKSLRRNIGVVMQDGKLFSGDIFSNITISAPWLTLEEAWSAAEAAGIAEDIRGMPMGMHTMISEGSGGVSGGQRQRLMIARAIAPKPRILMFDEATSALDNITQKMVSDSLAKLKCTRIVIAHRLSTIKACDRILVLEQGRIVEEGTYEELVANKGFFAELVARQQLNTL